MTAQDPSTWITLLDRVGWPAFIILCSAYGLARFARWFAPLVEGLFKVVADFMGSLDEKLAQLKGSVDRGDGELRQGLNRMADAVSDLARKTGDLLDEIKRDRK